MILRTENEVQRAHDILCPVVAGEVVIPISERGRKALHAAHDAIAWALGFECGGAFEETIQRVLLAADAAGYAFEDGGETAKAGRHG